MPLTEVRMAAYGIQSQSYNDYLEKHPNLNFPKFTELAHPCCGHFGDGAWGAGRCGRPECKWPRD